MSEQPPTQGNENHRDQDKEPLLPGIALLATLAVIVAGVYTVFAVRAGSLSDHITPEGSNRD